MKISEKIQLKAKETIAKNIHPVIAQKINALLENTDNTKLQRRIPPKLKLELLESKINSIIEYLDELDSVKEEKVVEKKNL